MNVKRAILTVGLVVASVAAAAAQDAGQVAKTVTRSNVQKATVTIQQIDSTSRLITFKSADGSVDTVMAGPEVQRFNELKVGDKVNLSYYESVVMNVRKPGDPPLATNNVGVTGTAGKLPGGTMAVQAVTSVTVKAVDAAAGTITVTTRDGRVISRKVDNKSNLNGVKIGDTIDIAYTEALLVSVDR